MRPNRLTSTDANNHTTTFVYDDLNRLIQTADPNNLTTVTTYDGLGNRLSVTNGANETTEFEYDGVNRLILTRDPLGNETQYRYDGAGQRVAMIDPSTSSGQAPGVETRYAYDDLGRLTGVTENYVDGIYSGGVTDEDVKTTYDYDAVGNRTQVIDARSNATAYIYDALNRRLTTTDPLNNVTAYGYDPVGNRTVITDANGIVTSFGYDPVNRLTTIDYSDSTPDVTFTYDKAGNRKTMTDGVGQTSYDYDALYRLVEVSQPSVVGGPPSVVGYDYDAVGNRTQLTYPNNYTVTYTYDPGNRLDTVTDWNNGQFGYNYDDASRLTGVSLPNGVNSSYTYDTAGRLELLTHSTLTDTIASYDYTLDQVGNRRVLTETIAAVQEVPSGAYLENNGLVVMEAENGSRTNGLTHNWLLKTSLPGYTGTSYLQSSVDIDALIQTSEITTSPRVDYPLNITTPGTYTVWLRGYASSAGSDSTYVGLNDQVVGLTGFAPGAWTWANTALDGQTGTVAITNSGVYTLELLMREDGLRIDRLLLTTDTTYLPVDFGPVESERLTGTTTLDLTIGRVITYSYDDLYRLTGASYSTGQSYSYSYDPVGNRLKQIIDGDTTEYLYDAANRLEQVVVSGQPTMSYTFDDNGNLLNTDAMTNTWDAANRLTAVSRQPSAVSFVYNGVNDPLPPLARPKTKSCKPTPSGPSRPGPH